ncbi:uncharacterized mitochondrial protein AtMg00810-like [Nicotiana sylvestris]|uniref:uncharacterized mitochondrial protein AtMg00810-like n=1 Tax=Nicotiana sylvestris TaxID=4096 RepID=UPI00388CA891
MLAKGNEEGSESSTKLAATGSLQWSGEGDWQGGAWKAFFLSSVSSSGSTIFPILDLLLPTRADPRFSSEVDVPSYEANNTAPGDTFLEAYLDAAAPSVVANLPGVVPTHSFDEAVTDPQWVEAMKLEIVALEENKTRGIVDLPPGKTPIGCKWIFKIKYRASGEVERYKARPVAKGANGDTVIILMYVDDFLITRNNDRLLYDTRVELQKKFKMKDLGELKFFLGIEFTRSKEGILMCQRKYALELIYETCLGGEKPSGTPLDLNKKLTSVEYDKCIQNCKQEVQVLSQYMHCPRVSHMEAALRVVRYIKQASGLWLLMPAEKADKPIAYCDSDWGSCIASRRSVTGYLVKFGNELVSWKSKKKIIVSRRSAKAEFRSTASCAAGVTWMIGLFKELGVKIQQPISLILS